MAQMLFEEIFVKEAFLKPTELRTRATTFQQKFEGDLNWES